MSQAVMEALSKFRVTSLPEGAKELERSGKYDELVLALKNLANDKCIEFTPSEFKALFGVFDKFQTFKCGLRQRAKKIGIKVNATQKTGTVYIWRA